MSPVAAMVQPKSMLTGKLLEVNDAKQCCQILETLENDRVAMMEREEKGYV